MTRDADPVRWLDPRSEASPTLRRILSEGHAALSPTSDELGRLEAVVAGIAASAPVAGGAAGALTGKAAGGGLLKAAAVVAIGLGVAGGVHVARRANPPSPAPTTVLAPVPTAAPVMTETVPLSEAPPMPPPPPPTPPAAQPPRSQNVAPIEAPAPSAVPVEPQESELQLLTRARASLAGDPTSALAALDVHRAVYAHGVFEQEREVLAVEALERLNRRDDARARGAAFLTAFPQSAHARRVRLIVESYDNGK